VKKLTLVIFVVGLFSWANGQDPQFTQFYANPLYLAPSFAGATQQDRITAVYRNQWPELNNVLSHTVSPMTTILRILTAEWAYFF